MAAFISCTMPDLADLEPVYLERALRRVFQDVSPDSGTALALTNGLDTSLDKAVLDYTASRDEIGRYLADSKRPLSAVVRSSMHLAGCIIMTDRACRFAEALRRDVGARGAVDSASLKIVFRTFDSLRDFRNSISHMDEKMNAKLGLPSLLVLDKTAATFDLVDADGVNILSATTSSLAKQLRALHRIAKDVAAWSP